MTRCGSGLILAAALGPLAATALPAKGEQDLGPLIVSGEAQVGERDVRGDDDSAKFEEYRDVGATPAPTRKSASSTFGFWAR